MKFVFVIVASFTKNISLKNLALSKVMRNTRLLHSYYQLSIIILINAL